jgi:hypothetical protein
MNRTFATLALTVLLSVSVASTSPGATEKAAPPVYYRILLEGAMFNTKDGAKDPSDVRELVMDLEQVGESWGAIYATSRNYNMGTHRGTVKSAKVSPGEITLKIGTDITGDKWVPGGQGDYDIVLTRNEDGTLLGSFSGNYLGVPTKGKASGNFYAPKPDKDFVPIAPQEHPRLLFRAPELPALRKKFATPFGQAAKAKLEASGSPAALGLLYQLTGDKAYAAKAEKEAEEYLAGRKPGADPFVPKKPLWAQTEQLALVYDLCYDALSPDFKARYRSWAADLGFKVYFAPESLGTTNWHVVSNHVANVYSGMTFSALVLFDEPSAEPVAPVAPFLEETLPPAPAGFKPGKGVPVVPFTVGKSPTDWIHTEPLRRATADDPREQFYGLEKLQPEIGATVTVGDFALTLAEQPAENKSAAAVGGIAVGHLIQADAAARAKEPFTMVACTVLEVKEPGQYVFINPVSRANLAQASVAGKLLADRQVVTLEPGLYPLTQMVQWRMRWGEIAPHFAAATPADVEAWKTKSEQIKAAYDTRLSSHASVLETWKRTAGGDPAFTRLYRLARFTSALHCEHAVGKGGFQGEVGHYSEDASSGHAKLWPAYRRVMGYDLTPDHEYPDYIPRKLVGGDQDINGITRIGGEYFPALYPTIRPEWRPDILSAWHKEMKITSPDAVTQVLDADPVRSFLYYPLTDKAAPIGANLPKVWQAPGLGYFAIRNGWDKDAFVAQVFLKGKFISGWSGENAGTYRLHGLNQDWATGSTDRVRARQEENVVWLPESELDEGARGKLTHFAADDKTMIVSVNLDEVYERKGRFWYTRYGNLRMPARPQPDQEIPSPSGITGMRSLGFDYSGLSGAPCLFALVDKIDGGTDKDRRLWLFQPALSGVKGKALPPGALAQVVKPKANGFIVQPVGATASLEGPFAQPADARVATDPLNYSYIKNFGKQKGTKIEVKVNAISVPGTDHFFFVGTVAPAGHPPVKVDGSGLDAVVTVGKRTVKFDGQKIVFGQK